MTGLALPWNKPGRTSQGPITVPRGVIDLPEDLKRVKLWRDHSDANGTPVGYCTNARETDEGLEMTFAIGHTDDGTTALTDIQEGIRDAFSIEVVGTQIGPAGADGAYELTAGRLSSVALVPVPAFEDARVSAFTASLHDTDTFNRKEPRDMNGSDPTPKDTQATAPVFTGGRATTSPRIDAKLSTFSGIVDAITDLRIGSPSTDFLTAALADIKRSANPTISSPDWLGELWQGNEFTREIVPTMSTTQKLKSLKATGWRWVTKPTVDDYAGDKADIPTNTPTTEAVDLAVKRLAGGHDIDRAYFDFNDTEFLASYFRAMSESYAIKSDEAAAAFLVTEAGKNTQAKQPDLLRAAAKARQIVKKNTRAEATTFLVHPDDMFSLMAITTMDEPRYLALVGVDPEKFVVSDQVPAGSVIAYNKRCAEFRELAGVPIRVQAEDIARGGRDAAVFGYYATFSPLPAGIVKVPFGAAPGVGS